LPWLDLQGITGTQATLSLPAFEIDSSVLTRKYIKETNPDLAGFLDVIIVSSPFTLFFGLVLPIIHLRTGWWIFTIDDATNSVLGGIEHLLANNNYFLAFVILAFSVIFPIIKIYILWTAWFGSISHAEAVKKVKIMSLVGHWSMLDVFVVGLIVVVTELSAVAQANCEIGVYFFCAHVVSILTFTMILHPRMEKLSMMLEVPTVVGRNWMCPCCNLAHVFNAVFVNTIVKCVKCKTNSMICSDGVTRIPWKCGKCGLDHRFGAEYFGKRILCARCQMPSLVK
jgi:paraquat-inducible protein A